MRSYPKYLLVLFCSPVNEPRDKWWPEYMALLAQHCHYTHARVGFAQGPQVSVHAAILPHPLPLPWHLGVYMSQFHDKRVQVGDPAAPEVSKQVSLHIAWWQELWRSQKARGLTVSFLPCACSSVSTKEACAHLILLARRFRVLATSKPSRMLRNPRVASHMSPLGTRACHVSRCSCCDPPSWLGVARMHLASGRLPLPPLHIVGLVLRNPKT